MYTRSESDARRYSIRPSFRTYTMRFIQYTRSRVRALYVIIDDYYGSPGGGVAVRMSFTRLNPNALYEQKPDDVSRWILTSCITVLLFYSNVVTVKCARARVQ